MHTLIILLLLTALTCYAQGQSPSITGPLLPYTDDSGTGDSGSSDSKNPLNDSRFECRIVIRRGEDVSYGKWSAGGCGDTLHGIDVFDSLGLFGSEKRVSLEIRLKSLPSLDDILQFREGSGSNLSDPNALDDYDIKVYGMDPDTGRLYQLNPRGESGKGKIQ